MVVRQFYLPYLNRLYLISFIHKEPISIFLINSKAFLLLFKNVFLCVNFLGGGVIKILKKFLYFILFYNKYLKQFRQKPPYILVLSQVISRDDLPGASTKKEERTRRRREAGRLLPAGSISSLSADHDLLLISIGCLFLSLSLSLGSSLLSLCPHIQSAHHTGKRCYCLQRYRIQTFREEKLKPTDQ